MTTSDYVSRRSGSGASSAAPCAPRAGSRSLRLPRPRAQPQRQAHHAVPVRGSEPRSVESATTAIFCVSGVDDINIGNTLCRPTAGGTLPLVNISEPTVEIAFGVNTSPLPARTENSCSLPAYERLERELLRDVALHVQPGETADSSACWAVASSTSPS